MKIAYKHLIKHIDDKPDIKEVSKKLFQLGHEHEIDNNNIIDIEITPNRGDCLSINGILRDLAAFYEINYLQDFYTKELSNLSLDFKNNSKDKCPYISFLKIEIEGEISSYKGELKDYFVDLNINKNNFFTDISNYVSYETGQPTHCYESDKINNSLSLDQIDGAFDFETLLDKKIILDDKNLVFLKDKEIINLAGVIGGKSTSCKPETKSALIECAYFIPEEIIGKSLKYDIQSEAAHKFERGVDAMAQEKVLRRFIKIVENHVTIKSIEHFVENYQEFKQASIPFNLSLINKIIGVNITSDQYIDYLNRLGFQTSLDNILIPSHRSDIRTQNDLSEEVARMIGYDQIPRKKIEISINSLKNEVLIENKIKGLLIDNGFYEVINAPFVADNLNNSIRVDNPLDMNREYLRTELKNSLVNNLLFNERRQKDSIKLFEISDTYSSSHGIKKDRVLAVIASGRVGKNYVDFSKRISKDYFASILDTLIPSNLLNFELISRDLLNTKSNNPIIYFELNLDSFLPDSFDYQPITQPPKNFNKYKLISEFPSSSRDISFSLTDFSQTQKLDLLVLNFKNELLKDIFIFDYFKNEKKNEIKIGYRFVFQSQSKTITDKEVDEVMNDIITATKDIDTINIPGLKK